MILYRIEARVFGGTRAGQWCGYYDAGRNHMADFTGGGFQPTISIEEVWDQHCAKRLDSPKPSVARHLFFAFNSFEQLESWFPRWKEIIADSGYRLHMLEVPDDCVLVGKWQCLFDPFPMSDHAYFGADYENDFTCDMVSPYPKGI